MNILQKLFGKWEKESALLVVEKHTRTGKKRAYLKDIRGNKTKIDVDYLKEISR